KLLEKGEYKTYEFDKISEKILKALCFIYREKQEKTDNFDNDLCRYLYYYLGDKIYPLVKNERVFKNIILKIYTELDNNTTYMTVCPKHYLIDLNRYEEYKLLFYYSKDYRDIELETAHPDTTCDKDYKQYIEKYVTIYKKAHSECYNKYNRNNFYWRYFSELFKDNEHKKLSSFSCKQRDNIVVVSEEQKHHEQQEHEAVQSYSQPSVTSIPPQQTATQNADLGVNQQSDFRNFTRSIETIQMDDTTEGGHSKSITGSVVPVLGVPFISFLLYRVTENIIKIHKIIIFI
ncbi:hypothetical protein PCYB_005370, partial [Plasmodium cynomolgi strain B]